MHQVHSQGTTHFLAPHVGGGDGGGVGPAKPLNGGPAEADSPKGGPTSKPRTFSSGPPSPSHKDPPNDPHLFSPTRQPSESVRPRNIPPPLRLDMDAVGRPLLRETRSQPTSPSPLLPRDGAFHHGTTPIQTPSALSLAQSVLGGGGAFDLDDERKGALLLQEVGNHLSKLPLPAALVTLRTNRGNGGHEALSKKNSTTNVVS
ncbi:hypothetical protein MATL_G00167210 [Megalops atlanticus]|uniref:Uncharacterized protein n=1 Tax=Megalops atlanticus TaxID=7932 RepID=A0A9D3PSA3_MEGAT|nr:hypothetical protein MATL_G00167210 [Megalops atlanticus]